MANVVGSSLCSSIKLDAGIRLVDPVLYSEQTCGHGGPSKSSSVKEHDRLYCNDAVTGSYLSLRSESMDSDIRATLSSHENEHFRST